MTQVLLSDQIAEKLQLLADERGATLMELIERIVEEYLANVEYDEALDPAIALFSGPADLASHAKTILQSEVKPQSGWTQKDIAK